MNKQENNKKSSVKVRVIVIISIIILILGLSEYLWNYISNPSRAEEVKTLKSAIPGATEFIYDNAECMNLLLDIKKRIIEINETWAGTEGFESVYYRIQKSLDDVEFELNDGFNEQPDALLTLTADEQSLIKETIMKLNLSYDGISHIYIWSSGIEICYLSLGKDMLTLNNPAKEIPDPGIYRGNYDFTVPVNDEWCIHISCYMGPW